MIDSLLPYVFIGGLAFLVIKACLNGRKGNDKKDKKSNHNSNE